MSKESRLAAKKRSAQAAKKRMIRKICKIAAIIMIPVIIICIGFAIYLNNLEKNVTSSSFVNNEGKIKGKAAKNYVTLCDYKNITLEKLADQVSLGKRQTERLLQMHYRKTFLQKKTEARMSAACSLLRDTKQSISDIADKLGYSSVEHFSNAFKRYYKQTPSDYRRSCRQ